MTGAMTNTGRSKLQRTATLCSQFVNVWLFDGSEDETVSGRAYREGVVGGDPIWKRRAARIDWWFERLPFIGEFDHCRKSHEVDLINVVPFCEILQKEATS